MVILVPEGKHTVLIRIFCEYYQTGSPGGLTQESQLVLWPMFAPCPYEYEIVRDRHILFDYQKPEPPEGFDLPPYIGEDDEYEEEE